MYKQGKRLKKDPPLISQAAALPPDLFHWVEGMAQNCECYRTDVIRVCVAITKRIMEGMPQEEFKQLPERGVI